MNAPRRIVLVGLAVSLLALPAFASAQDGGVRGERRGRGGPPSGERAAGERCEHRGRDPEQILARMEQKLDAMKGPLGLDQAQERRIRTLMRQGAARAREVLTRQPEPSPERRAALRQIREDVREGVRAVLTPEQRERFQELRREHRQERRARHQQRRAQ